MALFCLRYHSGPHPRSWVIALKELYVPHPIFVQSPPYLGLSIHPCCCRMLTPFCLQATILQYELHPFCLNFIDKMRNIPKRNAGVASLQCSDLKSISREGRPALQARYDGHVVFGSSVIGNSSLHLSSLELQHFRMRFK